MNNPPFHIGQKVVALKTKSNGFGVGFIKGHVYTVKNIKAECSCGYWMVDIGLIYNNGKHWCECGKPLKNKAKAVWISNLFFAPIETNYADATNEILEKFPATEGGKVDKILIPERII